MIAMAMMSSTIATASRNTRVPSLTRSPSSAISPTANAMSVAHAIAQPCAPSPPATIATKITIGATTPPTAASAGSAAVRGVLQAAVDDLALDLEPDDEEEHGHQPVVDPVVQVERAELGVPEPVVVQAGRWPR